MSSLPYIQRSAQSATVSPLTPLAELGWVRLAAYGHYAHARGMQAVTPEAAQALARRFASLLGKLRRCFRSVPIYIGHPDDAAFAGQPGHNDRRVYGQVLGLEARADGLWVLPAFGPAGRQLIQTGRYRYFSPRWTVRLAKQPVQALEGFEALQARGQGSGSVGLGAALGVWQPVELLSLGLTNMPNIPGQVLCNVGGAAASLACDAKALGGDASAQEGRVACQLKTSSQALPALRFLELQPKVFQDLVQKQMRRSGKDYLSAWSELNSQRSFPFLQGTGPYENGHKTIKT